MTRRWADEPIEQGACRIGRHRGLGVVVGLGCGTVAAEFARGDLVEGAEHVTPTVVLDDGLCGAGHIDSDRDQASGEEALISDN